MSRGDSTTPEGTVIGRWLHNGYRKCAGVHKPGEEVQAHSSRTMRSPMDGGKVRIWTEFKCNACDTRHATKQAEIQHKPSGEKSNWWGWGRSRR